MAGTVVAVGPGVEDFSVGDRVFAMADNTYAELCVVKAAILAKVPAGLDLIEAAALPLVTTTGNQLLSATGIKAGQTVMVVGALVNVGRSAVFTAEERGRLRSRGLISDAPQPGDDSGIAEAGWRVVDAQEEALLSPAGRKRSVRPQVRRGWPQWAWVNYRGISLVPICPVHNFERDS